MPASGPQPPELPEFMTWEDLDRLPPEIADQIELWDGRVVWARRGPTEHQAFMCNLTVALKKAAKAARLTRPDRCWRADLEINIFFGAAGKNDFVTPDFLVHPCPEIPFQDVRADTVLLAGEILSPSNRDSDMEAKKARYARAGIPWYWEVALATTTSAIANIRAYALEISRESLADGAHPLWPVNYILVREWTLSADPDGISIEFPFPIHIPWTDLEF